MKKLLCVLLAAVMVLALAACGGNDAPAANGDNDPQQEPQTQSVDLKQTAADAVAALGDEYPMFPVEDAEELEGLYPGLSAIETKQVVAYQPPVSGFGCELAMVEVANADDVAKVEEIMNARISYQVGDGTSPGGAWYPETMDQWENNSRVVSVGNSVMLVVMDNADDLLAAASVTVDDVNGVLVNAADTVDSIDEGTRNTKLMNFSTIPTAAASFSPR